MKYLATLCLLIASVNVPALALPTMIRLGYPSCVSCHVAPQGSGLLNLYGRSVDQAQSFQGGEYEPWQSPIIQFLNADGRINQDFRVVLQQQDNSTNDKRGTQLFRSRFYYRNTTDLGKGFRISAVISGENTPAPRPSFPFDSPNKSSQVFVNQVLLSYRFRENAEVSVGRDYLPVGVNIADLGTFVRSRNREGYYDVPTQAKLFWWGKRYQVTAYAYAPGGNERVGQHESGGGLIAEYDLFGQGRTVVGSNFLHGSSAAVDRNLIGPYVRLGFGRWGILAEHDISVRKFKTDSVSFAQSTSYGQLFWAVREWLVPSLIVERVQIGGPFSEHLDAGKVEIAARLTSQLTVSVGPRIQRDELTGRISRSVLFQVTMKSVH